MDADVRDAAVGDVVEYHIAGTGVGTTQPHAHDDLNCTSLRVCYLQDASPAAPPLARPPGAAPRYGARTGGTMRRDVFDVLSPLARRSLSGVWPGPVDAGVWPAPSGPPRRGATVLSLVVVRGSIERLTSRPRDDKARRPYSY